MKYLFLSLWILFSFSIFVPADVIAQEPGLWQLSQCSGTDCTACNVVYLANGVIKWLIGILFVLFAVLVVIAGVRLVVSGGNHHALDEAKDMFLNAIIGFIIVLAAWLIVDTVMRALVGGGGDSANDGSLSITTGGNVTGWLFWSDVQCQEVRTPTNKGQVTLDYEQAISSYEEDISALYESPCNKNNATAAEISAAGCNVSLCTATSCLTSCLNLKPAAAVGRSGSGSYCVSQVRSVGPLPTGIVTNTAMGPIFDPVQGGSSMVRSGAAARMQQTLSGQFARLQQNFGRSVVINDAIAKAGTSREGNTANSRHFYGDALDLSTAGMSNADKLRLFESARRAGFTGFGFGNNILHVDLGPSRGWAYGNTTYGGRSVSSLISSI